MLILGIDDAGRGPIIGPMILAGVLVTKEQEKILKSNKIRDSKLVSHPERTELAKLIEKNSVSFNVIRIFPDEIDGSIAKGTNLNEIEAIAAAKIINALNSKKVSKEKIKVIVDCPSNNTMAWRNELLKYVEKKENLMVSCEHKADFNHVSAGAASILAKVSREEEMEKIKKQFEAYGEVGSGYPSDSITQKFLKKYGRELKDSGLFRKSWQTWKSLFPAKSQTTLREFS